VTDIPAILLALTVSAYWVGVAVMIRRVRRHARRAGTLDVVVPDDPHERRMWLVWVPLVVAWIALPWLALSSHSALLAVPEFARTPVYGGVRWIAALGAVACLLVTIKCWARMGRDWRMGIDLRQKADLITDGPFARVRHPIYALGIGLVLCSAIVLPTLPMLVLAVVQIVLYVLKATNEERHLVRTHGEAYVRYLARTGRFLPRFGTRA
jgi:protein-S-isoprenylcysteine O-methyltransferase Ste14